MIEDEVLNNATINLGTIDFDTTSLAKASEELLISELKTVMNDNPISILDGISKFLEHLNEFLNKFIPVTFAAAQRGAGLARAASPAPAPSSPSSSSSFNSYSSSSIRSAANDNFNANNAYPTQSPQPFTGRFVPAFDPTNAGYLGDPNYHRNPNVNWINPFYPCSGTQEQTESAYFRLMKDVLTGKNSFDVKNYDADKTDLKPLSSDQNGNKIHTVSWDKPFGPDPNEKNIHTFQLKKDPSVNKKSDNPYLQDGRDFSIPYSRQHEFSSIGDINLSKSTLNDDNIKPILEDLIKNFQSKFTFTQDSSQNNFKFYLMEESTPRPSNEGEPQQFEHTYTLGINLIEGFTSEKQLQEQQLQRNNDIKEIKDLFQELKSSYKAEFYSNLDYFKRLLHVNIEVIKSALKSGFVEEIITKKPTVFSKPEIKGELSESDRKFIFERAKNIAYFKNSKKDISLLVKSFVHDIKEAGIWDEESRSYLQSILKLNIEVIKSLLSQKPFKESTAFEMFSNLKKPLKEYNAELPTKIFDGIKKSGGNNTLGSNEESDQRVLEALSTRDPAIISRVLLKETRWSPGEEALNRLPFEVLQRGSITISRDISNMIGIRLTTPQIDIFIMQGFPGARFAFVRQDHIRIFINNTPLGRDGFEMHEQNGLPRAAFRPDSYIPLNE